MHARPWLSLAAVCAGLALVSLASSWAPLAELAGQAPALSFLRKTVSKLVNCGTLWAGIAVLAGWLMRCPLTSLIAAVLAAEAALTLHYGLGQLMGLYDAGTWAENAHWFALGVLACAPLGLVGRVARRASWLGCAARLVVPLGALAKPWVRSCFTQPAFLPWPERWSDAACGLILTTAGLVGIWAVVRATALASRQGTAPTRSSR